MSKLVVPATMLKGVGKWITLGVTTAAAIIGLLVNAKNLGLTPWLSVEGLSFADLAARRVTVAPTVATLEAVGDTLLLSATVVDQHGATISGATLLWRTDDSAVVVVDSSGTAIARGPGSASVSVTIRDLTARARVTVSPRLARVVVTGDSSLTMREGDEARLVAVAVDARGHPIRALSPVWVSGDTLVAAVDASGNVTARAPGRTRLTASVEGKSAAATVDVLLAPASVGVVSGADQRVVAGRGLPERIVVQVLSKGGRPVPGIAVRVAPGSGQGAAQPSSDTTDRTGRIRTAWTLAPIPGRQRLLITAEGVDEPVTVSAEADPIRANTRVELAGETPTGRVGEQLPQEITVRVTDSLGVVLTDVPVTWTTVDGGRAEPLALRTDSLGEARARWMVGPRPGLQRLNVYAGNPRTMPAYVITVRAMSGWPAALKVLEGNSQRGPVGRALPVRLSVQVTDKGGNPIPDVPVSARALAGDVDDSIVVTDATGLAFFRWTLGRSAGGQEVEFRTTGLDAVAKAGARGLPLVAANVALEKAPATATAGRVLPVTVLVTDEYGNPVPDAPLVLSVKTGALSAARIMTDAKGRAATRWTLGSTPGDQTVTAIVRGTTVATKHTVSVARPRRR